MNRLALLLLALAAFWIGAPACTHQGERPASHHAMHHQRHDGMAQACTGCALPAVVPETLAFAPLATVTVTQAACDMPGLASLHPDAQAPPPRPLA